MESYLYSAIWVVLPGIYAKHFGLALTDIALVVFIGRLFDGVTDPTIGYFANKHRASGGSRKPWIMVGGIGMVVSCFFLFSPPGNVSVTFYLIWMLIFYLAFTAIEIPYLAWGSELTTNYVCRAKVYNIRTFS